MSHERRRKTARGCPSITPLRRAAARQLASWGRTGACRGVAPVSSVLGGFGRGAVAGGAFVLCKSMHMRWGVGMEGGGGWLGGVGGAVEQSGHVAPGRQAE